MRGRCCQGPLQAPAGQAVRLRQRHCCKSMYVTMLFASFYGTPHLHAMRHCTALYPLRLGHLILSAAKSAERQAPSSERQAASSPVRHFSFSSLARRSAWQTFNCASSSVIVKSISEAHHGIETRGRGGIWGTAVRVLPRKIFPGTS